MTSRSDFQPSSKVRRRSPQAQPISIQTNRAIPTQNSQMLRPVSHQRMTRATRNSRRPDRNGTVYSASMVDQIATMSRHAGSSRKTRFMKVARPVFASQAKSKITACASGIQAMRNVSNWKTSRHSSGNVAVMASSMIPPSCLGLVSGDRSPVAGGR